MALPHRDCRRRAQGLTRLEHALAADDTFALVLMDIQMPVMDGLEATRRIRENPLWRHLPIVAMTAHATNEDRKRCLEAGMNYYVLRPVNPDYPLQTFDRFVMGAFYDAGEVGGGAKGGGGRAVPTLCRDGARTVVEDRSGAGAAGPLQGTAKESTAGGGAEDGDGGPA